MYIDFIGKAVAELKKKKSSIESKVLALITRVSLVSLIITAAVSYFGVYKVSSEFIHIYRDMSDHAADNSRAAIEELTAKELLLVSTSKAEYIEELFTKYEKYLDNTAVVIEEINKSPESFLPTGYSLSFESKAGSVPYLLYSTDADRESLADDTSIYANVGKTLSRIALSDNVVSDAYYASESGLFYVVSDKKFLEENKNFDFKERDWYINAKKQGEFVVSEVHSDPFGREEIICFSKPVYAENGEFLGVAGLNVRADKLKKQLDSDDSLDCRFIIFSEEGKVVVANTEWTREKDVDLSEYISEKMDIYDRIINTESGTKSLTIGDRHLYVAHTRLDSQRWIVAAYINTEQALSPSEQIKNDIILLSRNASDKVIKYVLFVTVFGLIALVSLVIFTYALGNTLSRKLTKPIIDLTESVKNITHGKLEFDCDIKTGDEIEDLADAFRNMTEELNEHIERIKSESKAREHHIAELDIAKKIQMSILPDNARDFDTNTEFEISASITPAKGVGGDFYDYFMVDNDHLAMVIADVSGKGVPAALFMVISKTLINNRTKSGMTAGEILTEVNRQLCINNDAAMFVTAFFGILNIRTGEFSYSNAGHTPPLIYRYKQGFDNLSITKNLFLAGDEETVYKTDSITLNSGDMIFLYTDGVTEAAAKDKSQYGKKRLYDLLNSFSAEHMTLDEIIASVTEDIYEFVYGADQTDDITMLITRFFK